MMATALVIIVVHVFAYDLPVGEVEDIAVEDGVGVGQAIEDKSGKQSASDSGRKAAVRG